MHLRALVLLLAVPACKPSHDRPKASPHVATSPAPSPTPLPDPPRVVDARTSGVAETVPIEPCATHANELIYVIDHDEELLSFDPALLPADPFHLIGKVNCESGRSPFSMAVDRRGIAWVVYHDGRIFQVRIVDGQCVEGGATAVDAPGPELGMGFASDGANAKTETLYVARGFFTGDDPEVYPFGSLEIAPSSLRYHRIGDLTPKPTRSPELTGTGDGHLFAYFPGPGHGFVQEVDRATARLVGDPMLVAGGPGVVTAYAFAHWGGVFYVFAADEHGNNIYSVNRKTGASALVMHTSYVVVGAGVSTCAPLLELPE